MSRWILVLGAALVMMAQSGCMEGNRNTQAGNAGVSSEPSASAVPSDSPAPVQSALPKASGPIAPSVMPGASAAPDSNGNPSGAGNEVSDQAAAAKRANETVQAMKLKDMQKLAELVHPDKGVQFSPYSHIDTDKDIRLKRGELSQQWTNKAKKTWGAYDGSGEPIDLTFPAYYDKFVYDHDYAAAPQIGYNKIIGKGNTVNNVFDIYPQDQYMTVEYHYPGFDPKYEGIDWASLRLVFEKEKQQWYLTAVIHDQHTM